MTLLRWLFGMKVHILRLKRAKSWLLGIPLHIRKAHRCPCVALPIQNLNNALLFMRSCHLCLGASAHLTLLFDTYITPMLLGLSKTQFCWTGLHCAHTVIWCCYCIQLWRNTKVVRRTKPSSQTVTDSKQSCDLHVHLLHKELILLCINVK